MNVKYVKSSRSVYKYICIHMHTYTHAVSPPPILSPKIVLCPRRSIPPLGIVAKIVKADIHPLADSLLFVLLSWLSASEAFTPLCARAVDCSYYPIFTVAFSGSHRPIFIHLNPLRCCPYCTAIYDCLPSVLTGFQLFTLPPDPF